MVPHSRLTLSTFAFLLAAPTFALADSPPEPAAMVRPPKASRTKAKRPKPKTKRGLPVVRPKSDPGPSRTETSIAANIPDKLMVALDADALSAVGSLFAAKHVELTPGKLVDGNAFFIFSGWVVPSPLPIFSTTPETFIMTDESPLYIVYPTAGLEQQELVVECEGEWPKTAEIEIDVGRVWDVGHWYSSIDITVKPKNGKVKFLTDTSEVTSGSLLAFAIAARKHVKKGEKYYWGGGNKTAKSDVTLTYDIKVTRCTIDQVEL